MSSLSFAQLVIKDLLENASFKHAFVLNSNNTELKEALKAAKEALEQKGDFLIKSIDAKEQKADVLLEELNSFPLFEEAKIVILTNPEAFLSKVKENLKKILKAENNKIFLWAFSSALTTSQISTFKKDVSITAKVKEKPWERRARVEKKIQSFLVEKTIKVDGLSFNYILEAILQDEERFTLEMEKLYCFSSESKKVTFSQVKELISKEDNLNFWDLLDSLFKKDFRLTIQLIKEQVASQDNSMQLLVQLRSQVQMALLLFSVTENQYPEQEFQNQYPYLKGNFLQKKMQSVRSFGKKPLEKLLKDLFEMEIKIKSEGGNPNTVFPELMTMSLGALND
ncbi:hypothetical protein AB751O23_BC_00070 [Chlamydiales bacterium SCGC AB-751-O23]|jgi:DNA polymerase III subunit delta|nr:hypothetical protein AB751O23_BC_00070 [Chlamydiales bacterium SCGC AB-751-O23]